jgi:hypothetical protein
MKKLILITIILLSNLWASSSIGSATAQFLEVNLHARNMAMGNALTSLASGASASLINPAGIVDFYGNDMAKFDTYFSYVKWPADINFGSLNIAYKPGFIGTISINATYVNYGDEIRTTADNPMGEGNFNISSNSIGLTYARYLTDKFSFGITAKMINEDYDGTSYNQMGYDIGTMYRTGFRNLNIGMSILHFSKEAQFDGKYTDYIDKIKMAEGKSSKYESWPLPMTFRTGMSMDAYRTEKYSVKVAFDMIHTNNSSEKFGLGTELEYLNKFFIRGGYQLNTDIEGLTAGLGAKVSGLAIDYAFNTMEYFGVRHRFSVGYCF